MGKQQTDIETTAAEPVKMKEESRDLGNGILVFKTSADDGTEFTLKVDDSTVKGKAVDGEVWFYAKRELAADSNIRLA